MINIDILFNKYCLFKVFHKNTIFCSIFENKVPEKEDRNWQ